LEASIVTATKIVKLEVKAQSAPPAQKAAIVAKVQAAKKELVKKTAALQKITVELIKKSAQKLLVKVAKIAQ